MNKLIYFGKYLFLNTELRNKKKRSRKKKKEQIDETRMNNKKMFNEIMHKSAVMADPNSDLYRIERNYQSDLLDHELKTNRIKQQQQRYYS